MAFTLNLERLSKTRSLWRRLPTGLIAPAANIQAYFSRYERHYVFSRELQNGQIGIMSIPHERMDVPIRLAEDLARLSNKSPRETD